MELENSRLFLLIIVAILIGMLIGAVIVYLFLKQKYASQNIKYTLEVKERLKLNKNNELINDQLKTVIEEVNNYKVKYSSLEIKTEEKVSQLKVIQNNYNDLLQKYNVVATDAANYKGVLEVTQKGKESVENINLNLQEDNISQKEEIVALKERVNSYQEKIEHQAQEVSELNQQFKKEFENLAQKIFEDNSNKFTQQNRNNLDLVLNPFKDQIENFRKKIEDNYGKESNDRSSLRTELEMLRKLNNQISQDAQNLTKALKGDSKTQGDWGEMILDSVLRKSGLREGHEYLIQPTYKTEEGNLQKPDVIINYPEEKQIIVDSKVSLNAYERYVNAEDKQEQQHEIHLHIKAIQAHIDELSKRNYQQLAEIKTLDYVMMFVPIEPAFLVALQEDDALWDYAYSKKVVIVGPTTLMATLKVIEELWRNEHQQKNIEDIIKQATRIYDKARGFVETLLTLQKRIGDSKTDVDKAVGQLSEGKGNFISLVNEMKKKGNLNPKKSLPSHLED